MTEAQRANLEDILAFTGGRRLLTLADVRDYTGVRDNRTLKSRFSFVKGYISAPTLATEITGRSVK